MAASTPDSAPEPAPDHVTEPVPESAPEQTSEQRWARVRAMASRVASGARDTNRHPTSIELARKVRRTLPGDAGFGDPLSAAGRDGAGTIARIAGRLFD